MYYWTKIRNSILLEQNLLVASLSIFLMLIATYTWYPILPIYLRELGANDLQVGFSYTLLTLSFTLMQFIGGILSDSFGRKKLIVIPTFFFPLLYFLAAKSNNWLILISLLATANSLSALQSPSFFSIIAESVPKGKRGIAFGIFELFLVLGITLGPALGMVLISLIKINYLFYLTSFITMLCAVIRLIWLKETHFHRIKTNRLDSFKKIINKKTFTLIFAFSSLILLFNLTTQGPFISLYSQEIMKLNKPQINLLFALGGLAAVIYSLQGGKITDNWGSRKVLIYSAPGLALSLIIWSSSSSFLFIIIFIMLTFIFSQSCHIAYDSYLTNITHQTSRGLVIGFIGTCTGLIGSIGPSLGGYLKLQFGPQSPFWLGLIIASTTSILLIKVKD